MKEQSEKLAIASGELLIQEANVPVRLSEILERAAQKPEKGIVYVQSDGTELFQSYQQLLEDAQRILAGLKKWSLKPQDKIIFQVDEAQDYIPAFWGCILGGFIPVPISISPTYEQLNSTVNKLHNAWQMLDQPLVLTSTKLADDIRSLSMLLKIENFSVETVAHLRNNEPDEAPHFSQPDDLTLLLLTSGSTGLPKAVMLNHKNLLSMTGGTTQKFNFSDQDVVLNWMPMDHVGAIVCLMLMGVSLGSQQVHVPTETILQNPLQWLDLIDRHKAAISWAPNFAFALINDRAEEVKRRTWDLSSMHFLINAGEQIVAKTARNCLKLLQAHGLPTNATRPAFGMSETCSGITFSEGFSLENSSDDMSFVELGPPINGASIRITDEKDQVVKEGEIGRLQVNGPSVTKGYYQNPEKNREVFSEDGWFTTGDLGYLEKGRLVLTGREKDDIIIRGVNYYSHEIESVVEELEGVEVSYTAACAVRPAHTKTDQLVVFFNSSFKEKEELKNLMKKIRGTIVKNVGVNPTYLIPVEQEAIPKTAIGKIQRSQLSQRFEAGEFEEILLQFSAIREEPVESPVTGERYQESQERITSNPEIERQVAEIWQEALDIPEVGIHENFFELGGHSLLLVQAQSKLQEHFGLKIPIVEMFRNPTVESLAGHLSRKQSEHPPEKQGLIQRHRTGTISGSTEIAVIGLACRFPGAKDVNSFWQNLRDGVESVTFFTDEEMLASGIPSKLLKHPDYVKANPILTEAESFDAEFFGYSAREAELMDPQQRLLLECAWESLENAGYNPLTYSGLIGVYASSAMNTYLINNIYPNRHRINISDDPEMFTLDSFGGFQTMVANDKDYLTTRISYKLNLKGPSINVQTACSSSLIAIHLAAQSLLSGECDMMLAGGVSVQAPQTVGHLYQDSLIVSPDGHCRAFDAQAKGTIFGSGTGMVVLKRLEEALADGDHIYSIIKGSATNNDGGDKLGYMAPSGDAQAIAASQALALAGVNGETISFVEAHGTGTIMGDPIEVDGLSQAFGNSTDRKGFCAIGSVKTNVGHLQIASGVVGFMKTALALHHKQIPPSLHFEQPNPNIDFAESPFYVNTELLEWEANKTPRRAGVNSLGIGGSNVHVIMEEAPQTTSVDNEIERPQHLLTLSAKTAKALRELAQRYEDYLSSSSNASLADICFTANTGRVHFDHRLAVFANSNQQLCETLRDWIEGQVSPNLVTGEESNQLKIVFLFTGQGSQYVNMGRQLYETQPTFQQIIDRCDEILQPYLEKPLLEILYPDQQSTSGDSSSENPEATEINDTAYTQPALFALEYALAKLLQSWGVHPTGVMGHSVGEYVAACVAGVFSLEDGLKLIAERGRLMQALPKDGAMAVIFAEETLVAEAIESLTEKVSIAAINGPDNVVISGDQQAIETLCIELKNRKIKIKQLKVSHAFHSPLMNPILDDFEKAAKEVFYSPPSIPLVSNETGNLAADEIATAEYWARHVRQPVRFANSIKTLHQQGYNVFVEVGPKPVLLGMGRYCLPEGTGTWLPSLREGHEDWEQLLKSLGELYVRQIPVEWTHFDRDYRRRRVALPTYPFQRQRYWLDQPTEVFRKAPSIPKIHSLLDKKIQSPLLKETLFETHFSPDTLPFLKDHLIYEEMVVAGATYISMVLAATEQTFETKQCVLEDFFFTRALVLPEEKGCTVQLVITPEGETEASFKLISLSKKPLGKDPSWTVHATGKILTGQKEKIEPPPPLSIQELWERCPQEIEATEVYETQRQRHIEIGASYQWVERMRQGDGEAICRISKPQMLDSGEVNQLHPGLIDTSFTLLAMTLAIRGSQTWVPFKVEKIHFYQHPHKTPLWAHISMRQGEDLGEDRQIGDIRLFDETGTVFLEFIGLEARTTNRAILLQDLQKDVGEWLYKTTWQPSTREPQQILVREELGYWLIFTDSGEIGSQLVERLKECGEHCILVSPEQTYGKLKPHHYHLNPDQPTDFQKLLQDSPKNSQCRGVLHLWSLDGSRSEDQQNRSVESSMPDCDFESSQKLGWGSVLHLVQALSQSGWSQLPRLWIVTRGAQPVTSESGVQQSDSRMPHHSLLQINQSPLWGLGRVIHREQPDLPCVLLDLDPSEDQNNSEHLFEELWSPDEENQIAFRQGVRHVARLTSYSSNQEERESASRTKDLICTDGCYLITGGYGGLGLKVAQWMIDQGAKHLVLIGRHGWSNSHSTDTSASNGAREMVQELGKKEVQIVVVQADVSNREEMTRAFEEIQKSMPPLRGVVHAAGVLNDAILLRQDLESFHQVMRPKVQGAWNLHVLTRDLSLDFFVCFSSIASLLGSPAQGNYAAGNAFLDALVHYRRGLGLPGLSINWGPWNEVGMAARLDERDQDRWTKQGLGTIVPEKGLEVLQQLLDEEAIQVGVLPVTWSTFLQQNYGGLKSPFLDFFRKTEEPAPQSQFLKQLQKAPAEERRSLLENYLQSQIARTLGVKSPEKVEPRIRLFDAGLDSLMAVELKNQLESTLGRSLRSTIIFDYPTMEALLDYLATTVLSFDNPDSDEESANPDEKSTTKEMDQLSEDELGTLLDEKLARFEKWED